MDELLDRFCRYVRIESTADEKSTTAPSSPGQLEMGRLLTSELEGIGLKDVKMSEHGIVTATVPGNRPGSPTIGWVAHVDTSPEFTAAKVHPIVHHNYDGKDLVLPANTERVIRAKQNPELAALAGKTIITTDGTTLLGADDKAGVAVVMEAAKHLMAKPDAARCPIRVCFTCDEEIGRGTDHIDLKQLGADVAYTLDGEGQAAIECETFSADLATVTISGVNTHPGYAKDRMINALRLAGDFLTRMPTAGMSPETTAGREGFLHPYVIEGGVAQTHIKILLRDFDSAKLGEKQQIIESIAREIEQQWPGCKVLVEVRKQYRNMADGLAAEPRAVELAREAVRALGLEPTTSLIRGGTDGSRLTEMGLPTPNLSTGMHNFHSPLEWACLEEMQTAVRVLIELARLWGEQTR